MKRYSLKLQLVENTGIVEHKRFEVELNLRDCKHCVDEVELLGTEIAKILQSIPSVNESSPSEFYHAQQKPLILKIAPDYNTQGHVTHVHIEVCEGKEFKIVRR